MRLLVLGGGKMAKAVAFDFSRQEDVTEVVVASRSIKGPKSIAKEIKSKKIIPVAINVRNQKDVVKLMKKFKCCVSAVPYIYNFNLAKAAIKAKCHFVDLGGNNEVVEKEFSLSKAAKKAGIAIVPDSGLAPGLVSNLTALGLLNFKEKVENVKLRVGGLPQNPKGDLQYMIVFSVKGLVNEYIEPVKVIQDFKIRTVKPMLPTERIYFKDYGFFEAFPTSGGVSTLPKSFKGKIKNMDYKTIRYPGHAEKISTLIELGLTSSEKIGKFNCSPRDVLENLLVKNYSLKGKDMVVLKVILESKKKTISYTLIDKEKGQLTAMMRCTGFPAAAIALMLARGQILKRGTLKHESDVPPEKLFDAILIKGLNIQKKIRNK
jgi:lysine 6-dehydrogenase